MPDSRISVRRSTKTEKNLPPANLPPKAGGPPSSRTRTINVPSRYRDDSMGPPPAPPKLVALTRKRPLPPSINQNHPKKIRAVPVASPGRAEEPVFPIYSPLYFGEKPLGYATQAQLHASSASNLSSRNLSRQVRVSFPRVVPEVRLSLYEEGCKLKV